MVTPAAPREAAPYMQSTDEISERRARRVGAQPACRVGSMWISVDLSKVAPQRACSFTGSEVKPRMMFE